MGILDSFERRLDRMVNGAFAKAFKAEVQPVEIAAGLQRELDGRTLIVSRARRIVPNVFTVELSEPDFDRLNAYGETVAGELATMVRQYADEQRYTLTGEVEVTLQPNPELGTGVFRILSDTRQGPVTPLAVPVDPSGQPHLEVDGLVFPLGAVTLVGRAADADIKIDDPGVSRRHCEIILGTEVTLRDLDSTNGTLVNGRMVTSVALVEGDRIQLGSTTVTYRAR